MTTQSDARELVDGRLPGEIVGQELAGGPGGAQFSVVRHRSLPGHPWVDHGEYEVDDELEDDIGDGHHQGDPLDHQVVALLDRRHQDLGVRPAAERDPLTFQPVAERPRRVAASRPHPACRWRL